MSEQELTKNSETAPASAPIAPKSRRYTLEEWQSKRQDGTLGAKKKDRAQALVDKLLDAFETCLMQPRSPVGECTLPAGLVRYTSDGKPILLTKVKIKEPTADEYDIMNAEGPSYYNKVHDFLVNCITGVRGAPEIGIPDIRGEELQTVPYELPFIDRLHLMYAIRVQAYGGNYPFIAVCPNKPKCGMDDMYGMDITSCELTPMKDPEKRSYTDTLPSGKSVTWHVLTGADEKVLSEEKESSANRSSVSRSIAVRVDELNGVNLSQMGWEQRLKFIKQLNGMDTQYIYNRFLSIEGDLDTTVQLTCRHCGHDFKSVINTRADGFFFPMLLLEDWKRRQNFL